MMDPVVLDLLTSAGGSSAPLLAFAVWTYMRFGSIDAQLDQLRQRMTINETEDAMHNAAHSVRRLDSVPPLSSSTDDEGERSNDVA